ncbi:MAG: 50S ribosomal protein L25 [Planctomycetaceae bacterium]|nr:MAG: 50S ribosomal protein L25 [Planctomycetaceae bacterium]
MTTKLSKLAVEKRSGLGSRACRRLRAQGLVPGNVYGHEAAPAAVQAKAEVILSLVKSGVRVIDLDVDGLLEKALLRDVKWDPFGTQLLHFDLMRIDPDERVTLQVPLVIRGTAPGVLRGGVLEQPLHALTIDCLVYDIPDAIHVKVSDLDLGQSILVRQLELPPGIHCHNPPDAIVVHVVELKGSPEVTAEMPTTGKEPELIGKKPAEAAAEAEAGKKK